MPKKPRNYALALFALTFSVTSPLSAAPKTTQANWQEQLAVKFRSNNGYSLINNKAGQIVTGDDQGRLHYWTAGRRWQHRAKTILDTPIFSLCANDQQLVAGGYSSLAIMDKQQSISHLSGHAGPIYACAYSSELKHQLASIDHARQLILWDTQTKLRIATHTLPSVATSLIWHKTNIVIGHNNGSLTIWNAGGLVKTLNGHKQPVTGLAATKNRWLITASEDGVLNIWDAEKYTFKDRQYPKLGKLKKLNHQESQLVVTGENGIKRFRLSSSSKTELSLDNEQIVTSRPQLNHGVLIDNNTLVAVDKLQHLRRWKALKRTHPKLTQEPSPKPIQTTTKPAPQKPIKVEQTPVEQPQKYRSLRLRRAKH